MVPAALAALRLLFDEIDRDAAALSGGTGLACPTGCGACCLSPEVEATELELLPLAAELFRRGDGIFWLEQLRHATGPARCVLYQPDAANPERGRCGAYHARPTLCRLFAFAARTDRHGAAQFVACRRHKAHIPDAVERAQQWLDADGPAPHFGEVALRLQEIDPTLGTERLPINEALRRALERLGLWMSFHGDVPTGTVPDDDPGTPPATPPAPPQLPLRPAA